MQLHGWGDEFYAVFETLDGYAVAFDPGKKAYCYAKLSNDGSRLVPTHLQVGRDDPGALGAPRHLRISSAGRKAQVAERYKRWNNATRLSERWAAQKALLHAAETNSPQSGPLLAPPPAPTTGSKVGLCLLIDFQDDVATVPRADIDSFCNGAGYTGYGNNGSIKQYFLDVSNGVLTYTNVVTAYIRIPNSLHPKSYYNDTSKNCGTQGNLLIRDAITIMKALPNYATEILPTFGSLDVDGSNNVVACNVFYAGGNGDVWNYGLWPHSWSLYNVGAQELSSGGKKVWDYQITNIGSSLELGTFCHENGHMLCNFPDIYDYDYDSTGGAGMFCLMNSGGHGTNPVQVCAYLKRAAGWATTTEMSSSTAVTASLVSSGEGFNHFYRYAKPGVPTEYYLIENRQASGRDANLPASGVAVWHIDELGDKDDQSLAHNGTHANYEATLVQADNLWHFEGNVNEGDAYDLFYSGNTAATYADVLTDGSAPDAQWWDGTNSGLKLHHFSASGTTMTVEVGVPAPVLDAEPPTTSGTSNTLSWSAVANADKYWVEYDTTNLFTSPDGNSGWIAGLSREFAGLTGGATYWYRAKTRVPLPAVATTWAQSSEAEFLTDSLTNTAAASNSVTLGFTLSPVASTVGTAANTYGPRAGMTEFNVHQCATNSTLTKIEVYLVISSSTALQFVVYESTSYTGTYNQIHCTTLASSGTGTGFYSSGTISVPLLSGRYYFIGVAYQGTATDAVNTAGAGSTTAFGTARGGGYAGAYYPSPSAFGGSGIEDNPYRLYQRLTTSTPTYSSSGTTVSTAITPASLDRWTTLTFSKTTPASTTLTVDVLDSANNVLASNVASNTDLNSLGITQSSIKLRANLATGNTAVSPALEDWVVRWFSSSSYAESAWSSAESSLQTLPRALDVHSSPIAGVAISSATGHDGATDYQKTVDDATTVTLTAPATAEDNGTEYQFVCWSGAPGGTAVSDGGRTISFAMNGAATVTAEYETIVCLAITVDPASIALNTVLPGSRTVTGLAVSVTNDGNVAEDISLAITNESSPAGWTAGTAIGDIAEDRYVLGARFVASGAARPADTAFLNADVATTGTQWCDGTLFGGLGNNLAVASGVDLYFLFKAPTSATGANAAAEHQIQVEVGCRQSP